MAAASMILSIDQGTTSSRAMLFNQKGDVCAVAQKEYPQFFPHSGWVEQDAETIWDDTLAMCRDALKQANIKADDLAGIGITNQRETVVVWDRKTGKPVYRAIVWQDRRTADFCIKMKQNADVREQVQATTGLLIDPYFSATKLQWVLDEVEGVRERAEAGELAAGTIDCWLLWHLTGGRVHATDASNAARTLLFNIHTQQWDEEMLALFSIPRALLPEVRDNITDFGQTEADLLGAPVTIYAMAGDQQAATVGQACFEPGMWKATFGTGCFVLMHTDNNAIRSQHRLLGTVAWRLEDRVTYALEGSIFIAGAAIKWLRDQLGVIAHARDTQAMAESVADTGGVYVVPAFTGLGAPHWDAGAKAAITGMTLDTRKEHIVRATLEAIAYQTHDLMAAFSADITASGGGIKPGTLRVDGGMAANDWFCQFLADILDVPVERPKVIETTALGAAYLAGLGAGIYRNLDDIACAWECERRFEPNMKTAQRTALLEGWQAAVTRVKSDGV